MVRLYPYHEGVDVPSFLETDKIEPNGYFTQYLTIAADIGPWGKVCEIGVFRGESLRMWQSLFPLGEVTGVDNDANAVFPPGTKKVIASQDDPSLLSGLGPFDLIVDDASHMGGPTKTAFGILWPRVNPGGYYVIEDWYVGLNGTDKDMLGTVESLLELLALRDNECDSILFRFGLAIVHKRRD
jgi:hypothetical protein